MARHSGYEKLRTYDGDSESGDAGSPPPVVYNSRKQWLLPVIVLLLASNILTWFVSGWQSRRVLYAPTTSELSPYAGLARDTPVIMGHETPYNDPNETRRNEAWEAINIDAGMIAVPDEFVSEKDLPESQRFVWDQSKSVYLLNGHHTLHCVRAVYLSLMEFWRGEPQSRRWEHVIHCVDQLRQEALCNADDTPRYSTSDDIPVSGHNQVRMCRSWDKLEEWAKNYNACYRYINQTASYVDFPQIERFAWCPDDSPYKAQVEKVFGNPVWEDYH